MVSIGRFPVKNTIYSQIMGLGFCNYWSTHWNKLDFAVVLLSMGDITFEVCSLIIREGIDEKFKIISPAILRNIRFLRLFRFTRVLRLIKVCQILHIDALCHIIRLALILYSPFSPSASFHQYRRQRTFQNLE